MLITMVQIPASYLFLAEDTIKSVCYIAACSVLTVILALPWLGMPIPQEAS